GPNPLGELLVVVEPQRLLLDERLVDHVGERLERLETRSAHGREHQCRVPVDHAALRCSRATLGRSPDCLLKDSMDGIEKGAPVKELIYPRLFLAAAERHGGRAAIHDGAYTATFGEHAERALRLTDALGSGLGLDRTDRFAVVALNGHRYLELYHA